MRTYILTALTSAGAVAVVLGMFFAGYFVRGWVDDDGIVQPASLPGVSAQPTPIPVVGGRVVEGVSVDDDPFLGPENAQLTLVEFSDFGCPFCKRHFDDVLPQLLATYGDDLRYVFRDFPITTLHPQAANAAEAAQCADAQGEFWDYHDILFENPGAQDLDSLKGYAVSLGLDSAAFDDCLDSDQFAEEVQADKADGTVYGVTGTPSFFLNGRHIVGAQPFIFFQEIMDEELAKLQAQ